MPDFSTSSLHQALFRRLLWPLIPVLLLGAMLSYGLAKHAAVNAYDAGILDDARDLAKQVDFRDGRLALELPDVAAQMLAVNNDDPVLYAVWHENGEYIAGDRQLKALITTTATAHEKFFDIELSERLYRSVVLPGSRNGAQFIVAVAQAVKGRTSLVHEIFVAMLMLGTVLIIVSIAIVISAVKIGLRPVEQLRDAIAQRNPNDLSQITESSSPLELRPIIHGINELLRKLSTSFSAYRRFVADAAHQLRTPLAALGSQLEIALVSPPEDTSALLKQLLTTTQRTSHLANQLLSLARLEHTEKSAIDAKEFDFKILIQEAASTFVLSAARKSIEFDFSIEVSTIHGSALLLRELLGNLLDNAVRYAPSCSVIRVSVWHSGDEIRLQIADAGPGLPASELSKLGTPFYQLPSSSPQGCGLGLAIVCEIAHLHNGKVIFSIGENDIGLAVTVILPQPRPSSLYRASEIR